MLPDIKAMKVLTVHFLCGSALDWNRPLSYREKESPAASSFKLQFVLNFRTGAALRGAQTVIRSAVARVKRIKSLIMIRNQGGTADIIRPFRFMESEGIFVVPGIFAIRLHVV